MNKRFPAIIILYSLIAYPAIAQNYPSFTVTTYDSSSSGYYFACPIKIGPPMNTPPTHMILDGRGNVVYYRRLLNGQSSGDFKLHPNGLMSYSLMNKFYFMDSSFTVVDSVSCKNGILTDSHDMQIMANGNYLLLGYENITMDLSSYYLFGNNNVPGSTTASVLCGVMQEQDANKNVVFEWHARDYFVFEEVDESWLMNPNVVDWTHCNSVSEDVDGNLLLSSRHFNEVTKINRQTGLIMWRLGGNANQFTFINDPMQFKRQHDARRISNGNLTLYDNGDGNVSGFFHNASAKEFELDETGLSAQLVWSYTDDINEYSLSMGNFQRIPGGNSLVGYGNSVTQNKSFSAINELGQKVFEIAFDDTLLSYRAFNYLTLPWNLNRPQIVCYEISGQFYLDAGPGYNSYSWSNGDSTQIIQVSSPGIYSVFVPRGQGFISSEIFEVYTMADPCGVTGVDSNPVEAIGVFPSLASDFIEISISDFAMQPTIEIFNTTGQLVLSLPQISDKRISIQVNTFPNGVYFIRAGKAVSKFIKY